MIQTKSFRLTSIAVIGLVLTSCGSNQELSKPTYKTIRVATFNVSMEANNYMGLADGATNSAASSNVLAKELATGSNTQIKNVAEIIQRVAPDILLLNEFDYIPNQDDGILAFKRNYLQQSQHNQTPAVYPYHFVDTVNTGTASPLYADPNSKLRTYGFGYFPGQYGMAVLSKLPIQQSNIRTFQRFLWKDMPNHLIPKNVDGKYWYSDEEVNHLRLSSKSHWDIPVNICDTQIQILASHPTPPVFDGPEDRNGRRNHDELRFWSDYISNQAETYHYDDQGKKGALKKESLFVMLGDMNASSVEGDAYPNAIEQLLEHPAVSKYAAPISQGGLENKKESAYASSHTAEWGMRADYVLPSASLKIVDSGVFWPSKKSDLGYLVSDRAASSDHRLVWVDIQIPVSSCSNSGGI